MKRLKENLAVIIWTVVLCIFGTVLIFLSSVPTEAEVVNTRTYNVIAGVTEVIYDSNIISCTTNDIVTEEVDVDLVQENEEEVVEEDVFEFEVKDIDKVTKYSKTILRIRELPNTDSEILGRFTLNSTVKITGKVYIDGEKSDWVRIDYKGNEAYVHSKYLMKEKKETKASTYNTSWSGARLTRAAGRINGPSGQETYYNLNMSGVVRIMRRLGFSEAKYPYWVREDGCKMLGNYIMVAANLNVHPRGSIVQTSLGQGIVCDTGTFAYSNSRQIDVAVSW